MHIALTSASPDEICYAAHKNPGADHAGFRYFAMLKWRGGLLGARVSSRDMSNLEQTVPTSAFPKSACSQSYSWTVFSTTTFSLLHGHLTESRREEIRCDRRTVWEHAHHERQQL